MRRILVGLFVLAGLGYLLLYYVIRPEAEVPAKSRADALQSLTDPLSPNERIAKENVQALENATRLMHESFGALGEAFNFIPPRSTMLEKARDRLAESELLKVEFGLLLREIGPTESLPAKLRDLELRSAKAVLVLSEVKSGKALPDGCLAGILQIRKEVGTVLTLFKCLKLKLELAELNTAK